MKALVIDSPLILSLNLSYFRQNNNLNSSLKDNGKKYAIIDHKIRVQLLKRILSKEATIKDAAKEFGVNFSTAKAILQTYRKEGRIRKEEQQRKKQKIKMIQIIIRYIQEKYNLVIDQKIIIFILLIQYNQILQYDLERDAAQHRRTFSPDLRSAYTNINKHPSIVQQQLNYLNKQVQLQIQIKLILKQHQYYVKENQLSKKLLICNYYQYQCYKFIKIKVNNQMLIKSKLNQINKIETLIQYLFINHILLIIQLNYLFKQFQSNYFVNLIQQLNILKWNYLKILNLFQAYQFMLTQIRLRIIQIKYLFIIYI